MIRDLASLEAILGAPSALVHTKVLPDVIPGMREFLGRVQLVAVAADTVEVVEHLDVLDLDTDAPGKPMASLAMVPGISETLRVNGVGTTTDGTVQLVPRQAYMHCAKAFLRSQLWSAEAPRLAVEPGVCDGLDTRARAVLAASPFAAVGTSDGADGFDCSPRGDPPGFARVLDDATLLLPERPGNKLADTLRNVIAHGRIALRFLVPGSATTLSVTGTGEVIDDATLLAPLAERGKTPKLGIRIAVERVAVETNAAIAAVRPWDPATHAGRADVPTAGRIYAEAFFADKADEVAASLDESIAQDERENLY